MGGKDWRYEEMMGRWIILEGRVEVVDWVRNGDWLWRWEVRFKE